MDLESKYEPMPSPASGRVQTLAALGARVSSSQAQRERSMLVQLASVQPTAAGGSSWRLIDCCTHDAVEKSWAVQLIERELTLCPFCPLSPLAAAVLGLSHPAVRVDLSAPRRIGMAGQESVF